MWATTSFVFHVMSIVAIIVLYRDFHFVDPALYDAVLQSNNRDIFALAVQLGRLDFLNSVLALLALVAGAGAVFGIIEVRKGAEAKAEDAAKTVAKTVASDVTLKEVERLLPAIVRRMVEEAEQEAEKLGVVDPAGNKIQKMIDALDSGGGKNGK